MKVLPVHVSAISMVLGTKQLFLLDNTRKVSAAVVTQTMWPRLIAILSKKGMSLSRGISSSEIRTLTL